MNIAKVNQALFRNVFCLPLDLDFLFGSGTSEYRTGHGR